MKRWKITRCGAEGEAEVGNPVVTVAFGLEQRGLNSRTQVREPPVAHLDEQWRLAKCDPGGGTRAAEPRIAIPNTVEGKGGIGWVQTRRRKRNGRWADVSEGGLVFSAN